jgi:Protein of unknown function (DUF4238)
MAKIIDEPASRVIKIFLEKAPQRLTPEARVEWTRFLMAMRLRDPHTLAELTRLAQGVVKSILGKPDDHEYLAVKDADDPATLYEWVEKHAPHVIENVGKTFLPGLIDHEKIGDHTINMRWSTFDVSPGGVSLLTGDRPFVATAGLADPKCIVALPLSPDMLFIATNTESVERRLRATPVVQLAKAMNTNIVNQAMKHVYGNSPRHLRFVENRLRRLPTAIQA